MKRRAVAVMALVASLSLGAARAGAAERVHGRVVAVGPGAIAMIRHGAFGGMPPMTMPFRLPEGKVVRIGDAVDGSVSRATEPWSLVEVRVQRGARAAAAAAGSRLDLGLNGAVPEVAFVDQRARPFVLASLRGRRYAMSFVYTRCQDARMCPLISAKYRQVQADRRASAADLVEVTLDPRFDTPPVLERYGRTFAADPRRWHLLTGDPSAVLRFAQAFGVVQRRDQDRLLHTERTVIVNADGRIERFVDDPSWSANELAAILARREPLWLRVARGSRHTLAWCGEALGAGGRIAVHHLAVALLPIAFLVLLVALAGRLELRSSERRKARR